MRIFAIVSKIEKDYLRLANLISRGMIFNSFLYRFLVFELSIMF